MKCLTCVLLLVVALMSLSCCCHKHSPERRSKAPAARVPAQGQTGCAENPLKVTPVVQEATYSCWAACGQMIMDYVRRQSPVWQSVPAPRQCEQAIREYPADCAGCCDTQMHMLCSKTGEPQFDQWHFTVLSKFQDPLTWTGIMDEIDHCRPFAFSWKQNGGGEHMEVMIGYDTDSSGTHWVTYLDPVFNDLADVQRVHVTDYRDTVQDRHKYDYYKIEVLGSPPP